MEAARPKSGTAMTSDNRRKFFRQAWALASTPLVCAASKPTPDIEENAEERRQAALQIRQTTATRQSLKPIAEHSSNGDESSFARYISSFTKGLPHTQL